MKSLSIDQDDTIMSSTSRKGKFASLIDKLFKDRLRDCACLRRFLPLLYLAICIPTVLFLVFFRQPLGNPDEVSHVARAYQLSHGVLLTDDAAPGSRPRGRVDEGLMRLGSEVSKRRFESLDTALPVFQNFDWTDAERLTSFNSAVYFPVAFIPQAVALKIARKLDFRLLQSLQLASILNAAVCLLLVSLAIHLAAEGKYFIALVGALPMTLHQFASSSPDGILIAGSLLMFSLTITSLVRSKVTLPTLIGVAALGALTAATKLPYLPMALAALSILWWIEWQSSKKRLRYLIACTAVIGISLLWTGISNAGSVRHSSRIQIDSGAQIAFLLSHPLEIPVIAFSTLYTHLPSYLSQIIGVLGWLDAPLPRAAYFILGFGLAVILAIEGMPVKPLLRWIVLAGFAASVAMIFVSLYLIWTPLGSRGPIEGVQGRYFLPILPFLVFLIPKPKHLTSEGLKLSIFTLCGLVGGVATVATIIKRYYS